MLLFLFSSSFVPYVISFLDFTFMGFNSKAIKQSIFTTRCINSRQIHNKPQLNLIAL